MKYLILALLILLGLPVSAGRFTAVLLPPETEIPGLSYAGYGNITHDMDLSYTVIDAVVENTGYETVFVKLPPGWLPVGYDYSARGEPVLTLDEDRIEFRDKYGFRGDKYSFINNYFVFESRAGFAVSKGDYKLVRCPGTPSLVAPKECFGDKGGLSVGWFVRPNERLVFHIRLTPAPEDEEAIFDPPLLEQNRSDIRVKEWNQEFVIYPDPLTPVGFLRAPYRVKGGTMVAAWPGIWSDISVFKGDRYSYGIELEAGTPAETTAPDQEEPITVPAWNEWFSSSDLLKITNTSLANLKTEPIDIPIVSQTQPEEEVVEAETDFVPVWLLDDTLAGIYAYDEFVRYFYEWKRDTAIQGIDMSQYLQEPATLTEVYGDVGSISTSQSQATTKTTSTVITVPEWYAWF